MKRIYPLLAGLAAPLLPSYLLVCAIRALGVDHVVSAAYGIFGFAGLFGGMAAGYVAELDAVLYGVGVGLAAVILITAGTLANAAVNPGSVLFFSADRLVWICVVTFAGALLGAKFGETRARREISRSARRR